MSPNLTLPPHASDQQIVQFTHWLLHCAIERQASDIHFEPYQNQTRIRFRIDGLLQVVCEFASTQALQLSTRLKVLSNLDIAQKQTAQDGRFQFKTSQGSCLECRVSTCPTLFGEKIVLRLVASQQKIPALYELGLPQAALQKLEAILKQPQGMLLVTGPTGSGKTVTLYSALQALNNAERNISTVEDPVEMTLAGINQVNVNRAFNLDFSSCLKTFLRQDPDIIMVGEIRDLETATMGLKAAQTGHLVLSTLHTNSAAASLNRLLNMSIKPFQIADSIRLILAQRLLRKLCPHCKKHNLENNQWQAVGCEQCHLGYKGRLAIFEIMEITPEMNQLILKGATESEFLSCARQQGMSTLQEQAQLKIKDGLTSLSEYDRVLG